MYSAILNFSFFNAVVPANGVVCPEDVTPSGPTTSTSTPPTTTKQPGVSSKTSQSKSLQKIKI